MSTSDRPPAFGRVVVAVAAVTLVALAGSAGGGGPIEAGTDTEMAVVDRFEGNSAVLVFDGRFEPRAVDRSTLPPASRHVDAVLVIRLERGTIADVRYDEAATRERLQGARARFDALAANGTAENPRDRQAERYGVAIHLHPRPEAPPSARREAANREERMPPTLFCGSIRFQSVPSTSKAVSLSQRQ